MPKITNALTATALRKAKASDKPYKLADGGGMYLLIKPDGSRYWRLDYRFDGKRKTLALGVYPEISLTEARSRRARARETLALGMDPAVAKKQSGSLDSLPSTSHVQHLERALSGMGKVLWDWDLRNDRVWHNAEWNRLIGLEDGPAECSFKDYAEYIHPEDRHAVLESLRTARERHEHCLNEYRMIRTDGSLIWVHSHGAIVERDQSGQPLRIAGRLNEITEYKRREAITARSIHLFRTIATVNEIFMTELDITDLMQRICDVLVQDNHFRMAWIGLIDADGVRVRPAAEAGFSEGYLLASDIRCDDSPRGQGPTGSAIRLRKTFINDDIETNPRFLPWRERARTQGYRSSVATPIHVRNRCIGAICVYSDRPHDFGVDESTLLEKLAADLGAAMARRDTEMALRESEEHARLLLNHSPEGIYGVDSKGLCTFVNPACLRMLGYEREEDLIGKSLHSLIHHTYPDGRHYPKEQCHVRRSTLEGKSTHVDNEVHWRADGSSFPVEYWSHPIYRNGELVGAVVTFVDITDRKHAEQVLQDSEERYRLISSLTNDLLYSCTKNASGAYIVDWATGNLEGIFGYTLDEILALGCWRCLVLPEDLPIFDRNVNQLAIGQSSECKLRVLAKDRTVRHLHVYSKVVDDIRVGMSQAQHRLYGACQDITDRRLAEDALRESENRFRTMTENSADWIWVIGTDGQHTYTNKKGAAILGYELVEFLACDPQSLVHPDDLNLFRESFRTALETRTGWRNLVLRWRHRNGEYRVLESSASPLFGDGGALIGFQGVDRDITERKEAEERIEFLAHHDALTGLPNRILLRDRFERALSFAERSHCHVALLFLDLDNFKVVNDTLGHAAGDQLLQSVVARLSHCMRDTDTVSRQGGDEFILLLNDIPDPEAVERIANDILVRLTEPMDINGHVLNTSCSIGISFYPDDGLDFDTLLQKADAAMYNAKEAGRNTYRFFDNVMNLRANEHLLLQNRLHQALEKGEFHLHFQPQLDIGSGQVIGIEALLRWTNPDLGEVPPSRFIPVAEDSGLIVPIGTWVLEEACRQTAHWLHNGLPELTLSVNLSALQFRRANLVETVAGALRKSGLPAHLLELELTESILLQDVEMTLQTVKRLKALDVRLSIDDFGTGYSSLSYLKRFAVDKLKIDQSFVRDIGKDPDDDAIVRAIIQLAKSLRLGIIAEGVETEGQLGFLRQSGCGEIQGYLFSRPLPADELEVFLRGRAQVSEESGALLKPGQNTGS